MRSTIANAKAPPRPRCWVHSMSASTSRCRMAPTSRRRTRPARRCSCRAASPTSMASRWPAFPSTSGTPTTTVSTIHRSRAMRRSGPRHGRASSPMPLAGSSFAPFWPGSYPIPTDGPVGEMIMQTKRHPMRPAHVHFLVAAPGYEPLITHVFLDGDKYLDSDVVFGVKDELVAKVEKRTDAKMPDGEPAPSPWHLMTYEFHMKPGEGAAPKPMAA